MDVEKFWKRVDRIRATDPALAYDVALMYVEQLIEKSPPPHPCGGLAHMPTKFTADERHAIPVPARPLKDPRPLAVVR